MNSETENDLLLFIQWRNISQYKFFDTPPNVAVSGNHIGPVPFKVLTYTRQNVSGFSPI